MATSGAITSWLRELFGSPDYPVLLEEAAASGLGARGLLMLPYLAGERTPILDPHARGAIVGLTTSHTRGDLYRAALEATAFGVRHNVEVMREAGVSIDRVFAVGGGTQGGIWTQIVSDITGLTQIIPTVTIGASYGAAYFAACLVDSPDISRWNPMTEIVTPDPAQTARADELYLLYRQLHPAILDIEHKLAVSQLSAV
jgi:xylulokinase